MRKLVSTTLTLCMVISSLPAQEKTKTKSGPVTGKRAPEIRGEDLDGKPLKLSDYRGKVVVLDFWGNW
jgi:hypothetical protein